MIFWSRYGTITALSDQYYKSDKEDQLPIFLDPSSIPGEVSWSSCLPGVFKSPTDALPRHTTPLWRRPSAPRGRWLYSRLGPEGPAAPSVSRNRRFAIGGYAVPLQWSIGWSGRRLSTETHSRGNRRHHCCPPLSFPRRHRLLAGQGSGFRG